MTLSRAAQRILDAAMALFEEQGFAATSIADIEAAAGLSVGAGGIYRHFGSKVELLEVGVRQALTVHEQASASSWDTEGWTLRDELTFHVRAGLVLIRSQRRLIRLLYRDLDAFPDLLEEVKKRLVYTGTTEFATRLGHMAQRHDLDVTQDFEALALVFAGAVTNIGVISATLDEDPPISDDRFVATWVEALHGALGGSR